MSVSCDPASNAVCPFSFLFLVNQSRHTHSERLGYYVMYVVILAIS